MDTEGEEQLDQVGLMLSFTQERAGRGHPLGSLWRGAE